MHIIMYAHGAGIGSAELTRAFLLINLSKIGVSEAKFLQTVERYMKEHGDDPHGVRQQSLQGRFSRYARQSGPTPPRSD